MINTPQEELTMPKRGMPVTIITGFLGSGKTTLLNHILSNNEDLKIAVLVNEFGDINIDSHFLISMDEDMVELNNGCICCTINDNLVEAVYRVLERSDRVDYMIVETTGVADPLPIILTFLGNELRELTRLDSIITMVDAETFTAEHFDSEVAFKQINYADITILNKIDLASSEQIKNLENYIYNVKQGARILHAKKAQLPLPLILDVGYNDPKQYSDLVEENKNKENHEDPHHHHSHHHDSHLDNDGFISISFTSNRPFYVEKLENFLQEKLPKNVFRAKGILWFHETDHCCHIFQLSGPRFDIHAEEWYSEVKNQLILIGRDLNADEIRQQLTDCLV
jgi:G3E family GTPase